MIVMTKTIKYKREEWNAKNVLFYNLHKII